MLGFVRDLTGLDWIGLDWTGLDWIGLDLGMEWTVGEGCWVYSRSAQLQLSQTQPDWTEFNHVGIGQSRVERAHKGVHIISTLPYTTGAGCGMCGRSVQSTAVAAP